MGTGKKKPRRVGPGGAKVFSCREGGHHPSDLALLRGWLEHRRPGSLVTDRRCRFCGTPILWHRETSN
jgi:hypothetical protein